WEFLWQRQIASWHAAQIEPESIAALASLQSGYLRLVHPLERLDDLDGERLQVLMTDIGRAHYRGLWSHLTDDEQLILVQLAREGWVNPRAWRLINGLVRRGLVRLTPAPRLMNASFQRFAESEETDAQVRSWETADGRSAWDKTRGIILFLAVAAGLIL